MVVVLLVLLQSFAVLQILVRGVLTGASTHESLTSGSKLWIAC